MKKIPNVLTVIRIVLAGVFVYLFEISAFTAAGLTFIVSAITDFLDGFIARKYKAVSDFGKFADPLADKILVFAALIMFVKYNFTPAWIVIFILFREFAITGLRMVISAKGKVVPAMLSGKIKTTIQMFAIIFILYLFWASKGAVPLVGWQKSSLLISNWSLFLVTLYSFIDYLFRLDLKNNL